MLNQEEITRNMRAVDHAIAQQALEGLEVPAETIEDMCRAARGEIDQDEVIRNIYVRFTNVPYVPIFQQRRRPIS